MKAVYLEAFGGSDVLKIGDLKKPVPAAHEVLIKLSHTSVNPVDYKIRQGHLQGLMPHQLPVIMGWDASGVIEEAGSAAKKFKKGEKVFAYARTDIVSAGTYAEYIVLPESNVARAPKSIGAAEAASVPLVALTAWQALFDFAHLKSGETVFIPGGSGGVGSFAIQLAKLHGAKVVTTTSGRNTEYVKSLGADVVIDYTKGQVAEAVLQALPSGVDVVFDCVGDDTQAEAWKVIKNGGRFVSIVGEPDQNIAKEKDVKSGFWFVQPDAPRLDMLTELIDSGKVRLPAISIRSVKEAAKVQDEVETRRVRGKIVLNLDF